MGICLEKPEDTIMRSLDVNWLKEKLADMNQLKEHLPDVNKLKEQLPNSDDIKERLQNIGDMSSKFPDVDQCKEVDKDKAKDAAEFITDGF